MSPTDNSIYLEPKKQFSFKNANSTYKKYLSIVKIYKQEHTVNILNMLSLSVSLLTSTINTKHFRSWETVAVCILSIYNNKSYQQLVRLTRKDVVVNEHERLYSLDLDTYERKGMACLLLFYISYPDTNKSKETTFSLLFYITVTVGSSTMTPSWK